MNANLYFNELNETEETVTVKTNPTFQAVLNTKLPHVHNSQLRQASRKEWAQAVRKLFKELGLTGISVTTPSYSMAQSIKISLPSVEGNNSDEHVKFHDSLWREGRTGMDCPKCHERWQARQHLENIILSAFPDLDNRSNTQTDYFDYCLSFS